MPYPHPPRHPVHPPVVVVAVLPEAEVAEAEVADGNWYLVSGIWYLVSGIWYLEIGKLIQFTLSIIHLSPLTFHF